MNDVHVDNDMNKQCVREERRGRGRGNISPYNPKNRTEMGPKGFFHKSHKCELLLSLILAEASRSETEPSHCLSHRSEPH